MVRPHIEHEPVLVADVLDLLAPQPGQIVVDATLGHGGHARAVAQLIGPTGRLIGLDLDPGNLERARDRLTQMPDATRPQLHLFHANFADLDQVLDELGLPTVDILLADLGLSTDQMLDGTRGFSFAEDGPLDMRLDERSPTTAADLLNRMTENELSDLIFELSQERFSRRIARKIIEGRRDRRIRTTAELVRLVCAAMGVRPESHPGRIHPATRTFLALRMAVNREPVNLHKLLDAAPGRLKPGGRVAIISFHSGEDRIVKQNFLDRKRDGVYEILTKKPLHASSEEEQRNPRSRSAKLRGAMRMGPPAV